MFRTSDLQACRLSQALFRKVVPDVIYASAADHDDRVVPLHSYKFISTLQYNLAEYPDSPQRNPLLLRVDHNAGHGGGESPCQLKICTAGSSVGPHKDGPLCLSLHKRKACSRGRCSAVCRSQIADEQSWADAARDLSNRSWKALTEAVLQLPYLPAMYT